MADQPDVLRELERLISSRMEDFAAGRIGTGDSRVVKALAGRPDELLRKIPEEAVEVILAVTHQGRQELVGEAADLIFHLLLVLHQQQVPFSEVLAELEKRLAEKSKSAPAGDG